MSATRTSEQAFMQSVIELAQWCGWLCYHTWNARHSARGFPDLVLVRPPEVLFVECKRDGRSRLTPDQQHWLGLLGQCPGVEAHLWRPDDFAAIEQRLRRHRPPRASAVLPLATWEGR